MVLTTADGFNLISTSQYSAFIEARPIIPCHQWFAGRFSQLPTDREVTIRLLMGEQGMGKFRAQMWKWVGLHPLLTYADPDDEACYEWFTRDSQGQWLSSNFCAPAAAREAGCDLLPRQTAIPEALARQFLSPDGQYWSPWREITTAEAQVAEETFTVRHRFDAPSAAIALHPPFTYGYWQALLRRVRAARFPGVVIDEIGHTREGRKLEIIRLDDPRNLTPLTFAQHLHSPPGTLSVQLDDSLTRAHDKSRVLLVSAREHATEHASSWVVQGILKALVADTEEARQMRKDTTWLLAPMYDPDGCFNSSTMELTNHFFAHLGDGDAEGPTPEEVVAYARYFRAFVNNGRPIQTVASFYCLECNEAEPICSPFAVEQDRDITVAFNRVWFKHLRESGLITGKDHPWTTGWMTQRLQGWCSYFYGSLPLVFEVNDRHPQQPRTLAQLEQLGADYPRALREFLRTPAGRRRARETRLFLLAREQEMALWYRTSMSGSMEEPTLYDLLGVGY